MTRHYTQWTMPELRRISARRMSGEEWSSIVQDYEVGEHALRSALARYGLLYGQRQLECADEYRRQVVEAIRLRNTQHRWPDIAMRIGWCKSEQALRIACHKHARRTGGHVWCGRGQA